jgi:hypothetical protein
LSVPELAETINEIERRVREAVPIAHPIYVEPDTRLEPSEETTPEH